MWDLLSRSFSERLVKASRWASASVSQNMPASLSGVFRFGFSFRSVVHALAVGGYAVAGGLSCLGLGQERRAPELLSRNGDDVHNRHFILPF